MVKTLDQTRINFTNTMISGFVIHILAISLIAVSAAVEYEGTTLTRDRLHKVCLCFKAGIQNEQIVQCIRTKRITHNLVYRPMNVTLACSEKYENDEMSSPPAVEQSFRKRLCGKWNTKESLPRIECIRRQTTKQSNQDDLVIAKKANVAMTECGIQLKCFQKV